MNYVRSVLRFQIRIVRHRYHQSVTRASVTPRNFLTEIILIQIDAVCSPCVAGNTMVCHRRHVAVMTNLLREENYGAHPDQ
jgi:hypothetical protein